MSGNNQFLIYTAPSGAVRVDVCLAGAIQGCSYFHFGNNCLSMFRFGTHCGGWKRHAAILAGLTP